MGRPSKFEEAFIAQAEKLCKLGATDMEIADFFEVEVRTLYRWKAEHPEFCQALKAGKDVADERVERSLYARANGYEHDEVDIRVVDKEIVQTPIRKYYPPDTTAAIFWLKNRRPEQWRETKAVELTGSNGGPVVIQATAADERI
ncbi:terminase [Hydrogenophaga crocea]|uniref:Terminase n=1 Tax=Hydrogenophaga crocea TaxID=2716225 RepID=A0A6G8IEP4_9BURK|nr:terminase [Hydrogenophaga crocea]QIM51613.1 terminase [Hydrogenophaga crocea]